MKEIWKPIPIEPFSDCYLISNFGRIKNDRGHFRKPSLTNTGYYHLTLKCWGKKLTIKVHRLVALTFVPNPNNKPYAHHKDHNKQNNRSDNLQWVTPSENAKLKAESYDIHPNSKGINQYDDKGNLICPFKTLKEASLNTGISKRTLSRYLKEGAIYKNTAGGFHWSRD